MIAILEGKRAGLLAREHWLRNGLAGVIVGIVALPLALAFAIASGAKPEHGLYTAIVAGLAVSLFGGSRFQIAGPTGAFVVILSGITAKYGMQGLQIATLMAGVILILLGVAKLGSIIKYIPDPVIVGFTTGIATIIWIGQWHYFFGLPNPGSGHFHEKLLNLFASLPRFHASTTLVGLVSLLILIVSPRISKRIPGPLISLAAVTTLQAFLQLPGVATIGSVFGGIPNGLPRFEWHPIGVGQMLELMGPAFTIALLGAIESLMSAVVADGMSGTRHDSNQELIGQGVGNLLSPLFGGFAATGAIARTATSVRNGATGPLAGIVHVATLTLIILLCAPLAAHIPLATLAAILFVVSWNMSELPHFTRMLKRAPKTDVFILLTTFLLTVLVDLIVAVNVGVILTVLLFVRRMTRAVEVKRQHEEQLAGEMANRSALPPGVLVYSIDGPFFFGAAENFERVLARTHTDPKALIIRLGRVPFMDITGIQALEEMIVRFERRGTVLALAEANSVVETKLAKAGVTALLRYKNIAWSLSEALDAIEIDPSPAKSK